MNTKNIFRMLLVAAALLLGANNVKADEITIWSGNTYWEQGTVDANQFLDLAANGIIKIYGENNDFMVTINGTKVISEASDDGWIKTTDSAFSTYSSNGVLTFTLSENLFENAKQYGLTFKNKGNVYQVTYQFPANYNGPFAINIDNDIAHGSISANKTSATIGESVTLSATAEEGYKLFQFYVTKPSGNAVEVENDTFVMPYCSVTATAQFIDQNILYQGSGTQMVEVPASELAICNVNDSIKIYCQKGNIRITTKEGGNLVISNSEWIYDNWETEQNQFWNSTQNCYIVPITQDILSKIQKSGLVVQVYNTITSVIISPLNGEAPADNRADVTLEFSSSSASATIGQTPDVPTLTATSNGETVTGLAITYSSSDQSVATVDASRGLITLKAAGTTTITASFAGDDKYKAAQSVSYTLTVTAAQPTEEYTSISFPSNYNYRTYVTQTAIDFSGSVGIKGYYTTGLNSDGDAVLFTEVTGTVPQGTPLLLERVSGATETKLLKSDASGTAPSGNKLKAGNTSWKDGSHVYVLTVHGGQLVFAETNYNAAYVDSEHAYLDLSGSSVRANSRLKMILGKDGEAAGISDIKSDELGSKVIYDLRGQRVDNPTKGIYIINGKKVVIK